jgi:hypothetical protein
MTAWDCEQIDRPAVALLSNLAGRCLSSWSLHQLTESGGPLRQPAVSVRAG